MSREFGEHSGGFFHQKIQGAAEDCLYESKNELTKLYGQFLVDFYEIAYKISSFEAYDSGFEAPITETIQRLPALKKRLQDIEDYIKPYKDVAEAAVRQLAKKKEK